MAIDYQSGSGAVAQKGQEAGEARIHEQARAANNERKMRLDLENIQYQATLQKAMMQQQMYIEQESRAKAWELEKMEIASRLDFQKEEQVRIKKETQYESALDEINKRRVSKGGTFPDSEADKAIFQVSLQNQGVKGADKVLGIEEGMTPYQKESLRLRELELNKEPVLTPYQQESIRLRDDALALREAEAGKEPELTPYQQESLELRKQAAERQAAKDAETEDPKKMSPNELASANKFLDGFRENMWDLGGFLGGGKQLHELAVVDEDGEFVRPATVAHKQSYEEVKRRVESGNKYGGLFDQGASASGSTVSVTTQEEFDALPVGTRFKLADGRTGTKG